MTRALPWMVMAVVCCGTAVSDAAPGDARIVGPANRVSRQLVEQKEALLKSFLSDIQTVRRIEASHKAAAKKQLAGAQGNHVRALAAIKRNDLAGADRFLDEGTRQFGRARRLVQDESARNAEQKARYAQTLDSVDALQASYQRHLQRIKDKSLAARVYNPPLARAMELTARARNLAQSGNLTQANAALGRAEKTLLAGFSGVLGSKTIEYAQRFETPAEEFSFELDRNRNFEELIPIAIAEFRPASGAIREIQKFIDTNRQLRAQAEAHAAQKEYPSALSAVRGGTTHLRSALETAGLRVPQDLKSE